MDQIIEFFKGLFDYDLWPPRWHCGEWSEFHGWLYICSDLAIWSAYFAIPIAIVRFINKKKDIKFQKLYFLFAAFILACGATHLLDAITFWFPMYRLNALVRFVTGVISWITVFYLIKNLHVIFGMKTNEQLEDEINKGKVLSDELKTMNDELLRQKDFIASVLGASKDMITVFDKELNYVLVNRTDESSGYTKEQLIGKNLLKTFPQMRGSILHLNLEKALKGEKVTDQNYYSSITQKYYELFYTPLTVNDNVYGAMIVGHDNTELVRASQILKETNNSLERSNHDLEQFAYVASHDLQEPLRKISAYTDLLEMNFDKPKGKEFVGKIRNSSNRMLNLIKGALDYSKISNTNDLYELVDLNDLLNDIINDFELKIDEKAAKFNIEKLGSVSAIKLQMHQLFSNLISNSLKYSEKKPVVNISSQILDKGSIKDFKPVVDTDKFIVITYEDNGIGFDQEHAEKIFGVFQRLHSKDQYEGTGIGLAICKKIVEKHNGFIKVSSKKDEGTIFTIGIPQKLIL